MKRNTWILLLASVVILVGGGVAFFHKSNGDVKWRTYKLERGNLTQRISATGAVAPMVQVAVGTQVSGVISALYADYNSIVKKGQLIAQIDPTVWETQLQDAQASLQRAQATYDNAKADYERNKRLAAENLVAPQDLDAKLTTMKTAQGSVESAKASLSRAKANLGYCNITAPVDGVVISRLADVGQTVAASFSTPNLFQIAQDLHKMKVQVSIDEADIDEVKVGQTATFTVDSLPDMRFDAKVCTVRQEPITTNNVVTYVVEMEVTNRLLNAEGGFEPAENRALRDEARPKDPEQAWERVKDRMAERGVTKEDFLRRFQERQAKGAENMGKERFGHGKDSSRHAASERKASVPKLQSPLDRLTAARTPGGARNLGGPVFTGNLALRPGMTANVTIETNFRQNVLKVPNAALRFNPAAFLKDEKKTETPRVGGLGQPMMIPGRGPGGGPGGGQGQRQGGQRATAGPSSSRIFVLENGKPKAIPVKVGITDGQFTEISGEGLQEDLQILLGAEDTNKAATGSMRSGGAQGGGRH